MCGCRALCEYAPHQEPVMALDSHSSFSPPSRALSTASTTDTPPPTVFCPPPTPLLSPPAADTSSTSTSTTTSHTASSTNKARASPPSTMVITGGAGSQLCLLRDFKVSEHDLSTSKNTKPLSAPLRKPGRCHPHPFLPVTPCSCRCAAADLVSLCFICFEVMRVDTVVALTPSSLALLPVLTSYSVLFACRFGVCSLPSGRPTAGVGALGPLRKDILHQEDEATGHHEV